MFTPCIWAVGNLTWGCQGSLFAATVLSWRLVACINKLSMGEASMKQERPSQGTQDNILSFGTEESIVLRLDQLESLGKCSVIYEIARIDTLLGQVFMQDLKCRLAASAWLQFIDNNSREIVNKINSKHALNKNNNNNNNSSFRMWGDRKKQVVKRFQVQEEN